MRFLVVACILLAGCSLRYSHTRTSEIHRERRVSQVVGNDTTKVRHSLFLWKRSGGVDFQKGKIKKK